MGSVLEAKELDEAFLFSKVLLTTNKIVSGLLILLKGGLPYCKDAQTVQKSMTLVVGAREMAQLLRVPADPSSIPSTHMVAHTI